MYIVMIDEIRNVDCYTGDAETVTRTARFGPILEPIRSA